MTEIEKMTPLNHSGTQLIQTKRLILRQFKPEDYRDMFIWASNPEVVKYLSYEPHKNLKESKLITNLWVKAYKNSETYNWAIEYEENVIGNISVVNMDNKCFCCHLGWQIDAPFWNKGIMTEAAQAVLNYLFGTVGFDRITSGHDTRNIGSGRVMEKIGMLQEGLFRRYIYQKDGSIGDKAYYAILKSDWLINKTPATNSL